jgi:hypothetical protein
MIVGFIGVVGISMPKTVGIGVVLNLIVRHTFEVPLHM